MKVAHPPLRICFLKRFFRQMGGLEKHSRLIVDYFHHLGHLVTLGCEQAAPDYNYPTHLMKGTGPKFFQTESFSRQADRWIRSTNYDIVFSFDRTVNQSVMRLGNGIHRAYLEEKKRHQRYLPFSFYKPLDWLLLSNEKRAFQSPHLKVIIANSHMVKQELLHYYSVDASKIHVLHNGIEWDVIGQHFHPTAQLDPKTIHPKIDPTQLQLLFVGHGFKRKGLYSLLKALHLLKDEAFQLHIVGNDSHQPFYEQLSCDLGLSRQVFFYGGVQSSYPFFQLADMCIIPSIYDPFANVTVEALSFGCFVLTSRKNGGHEILTAESGAIIDDISDDRAFKELIVSNWRKKTVDSAIKIRNSIEYLKIDNQLEKLTSLCLF